MDSYFSLEQAQSTLATFDENQDGYLIVRACREIVALQAEIDRLKDQIATMSALYSNVF